MLNSTSQNCNFDYQNKTSKFSLFSGFFVMGQIFGLYKNRIPDENIIVKTTKCIVVWKETLTTIHQYFRSTILFQHSIWHVLRGQHFCIFYSTQSGNGGVDENMRNWTPCWITPRDDLENGSSMTSKHFRALYTFSSQFQSSGRSLINRWVL